MHLMIFIIQMCFKRSPEVLKRCRVLPLSGHFNRNTCTVRLSPTQQLCCNICLQWQSPDWSRFPVCYWGQRSKCWTLFDWGFFHEGSEYQEHLNETQFSSKPPTTTQKLQQQNWTLKSTSWSNCRVGLHRPEQERLMKRTLRASCAHEMICELKICFYKRFFMFTWWKRTLRLLVLIQRFKHFRADTVARS